MLNPVIGAKVIQNSGKVFNNISFEPLYLLFQHPDPGCCIILFLSFGVNNSRRRIVYKTFIVKLLHDLTKESGGISQLFLQLFQFFLHIDCAC